MGVGRLVVVLFRRVLWWRRWLFPFVGSGRLRTAAGRLVVEDKRFQGGQLHVLEYGRVLAEVIQELVRRVEGLRHQHQVLLSVGRSQGVFLKSVAQSELHRHH
jgi:hypothetical protein